VLFNSLHFIYFLTVVFLLYWSFAHKYRWKILLAAGYYFYISWSMEFALVLLLLSLISYYSAIRLFSGEGKNSKFWLWLAIIANIGGLFVFKYLGFFNKGWIVPIGISYYSLQLTGYVIDVYRKKAEPETNLVRFTLFSSFFPIVLSGPVERFSNLMPQFFVMHQLTRECLISAVRIITWGFFKKMVIADRLAEFVNPVFAEPSHYSGLTLLVIAFFFVVQVYTDFSGYTDIATGVALLFGMKLSLNWCRPLLSHSLMDFWKRNNISLTSWFRDYLYFGLVGRSRSYVFWLFGIFVVFVVSGLWHGASSLFLIWGALHGLVYTLEFLISKKIRLPRKFFFFGWIYLIAFYTLAIVPFRAGCMADLIVFYKKIFSFNYNWKFTLQELITVHSFFSLLIGCGLIVFLFLKELKEEGVFGPATIRWQVVPLKPFFYVLVFVLIFVLGKFDANGFIYTHF